jgi:hypothetical protein
MSTRAIIRLLFFIALCMPLIGAAGPTDTARQSFSRDTLEVRQRLFAGDIKGANDLVCVGRGWMDHPRESLLWKARCLVFGGRYDDLSSLIDTIRLDPAWEYSRELLDYRYYMKLLSGSNGALEAWSAIECDLYTGKREQALQTIKGRVLPDDLRMALLSRITRETKIRNDTALIRRIFEEQGAPVDSPELLYLYAEALANAGNGAQAQELLLRLIRDFPGDVFSQKARILLVKLRDQS